MGESQQLKFPILLVMHGNSRFEWVLRKLQTAAARPAAARFSTSALADFFFTTIDFFSSCTTEELGGQSSVGSDALAIICSRFSRPY